MLVLWVASDWPVHDISEEYLYSVHMVQHMALSYFLPPLALMATPDVAGPRAARRRARSTGSCKWFTHPVVAGVLFNAMVMIVHIPMLVNASVESGPLHYGLHVLVVTTSLLMWMPVCGPIPEFRIGVVGSMIYLFLQSVVPTIPAAWLTFAEDVVYKSYDTPAAAVGHQRRRGSTARRSGDEDRRRVVPLDDRDLPVLQALRRAARRHLRLPARHARCPTPRSSATTRCRSPPPTSSASSPRTDAPEPH